MPILTSQERIGTVVDDKYRLDGVLGEGGMGVVYDAMHLRLERRVAVKFLHPQFSRNDEVVTRFIREAKATSRLQHPNVVDVRDVDVAPDSSVYMVLEFLEGESLAAHLRRRGHLELRETLAIIGPVCDALAAAHEAGIVHRDIKPDNVFLSRVAGGRTVVKVLDFGIAKLAEAGAGGATQTGSVMGTPLYMSPEQAMGRVKDIGPWTDLWSTAVMAYECLCGEPPFDIAADATPTAVVVAVMTAPIVPLRVRRPDLAAVDHVFTQALDRVPAARFQSMNAFFDALANARDGTAPSPSVVTRPGTGYGNAKEAEATRGPSEVSRPVAGPAVAALATPSPASSPRRRPWIWIAAAVIGVGALVAIGLALAVINSSGAGSTPIAPAVTASPPPRPPVAARPSQVANAPAVPSTPEPAPAAVAVPPPTAPATAPQDVRPREHGSPQVAARTTRPASGGAQPGATAPPHEAPTAATPPAGGPATGQHTHRSGGVSIDDF